MAQHRRSRQFRIEGLEDRLPPSAVAPAAVAPAAVAPASSAQPVQLGAITITGATVDHKTGLVTIAGTYDPTHVGSFPPPFPGLPPSPPGFNIQLIQVVAGRKSTTTAFVFVPTDPTATTTTSFSTTVHVSFGPPFKQGEAIVEVSYFDPIATASVAQAGTVRLTNG